jgi:hypothetical protein
VKRKGETKWCCRVDIACVFNSMNTSNTRRVICNKSVQQTTVLGGNFWKKKKFAQRPTLCHFTALEATNIKNKVLGSNNFLPYRFAKKE